MKKMKTLKELIMGHDFDSIVPELKKIDDHAERSLAGYKEGYDTLRLMGPDQNFDEEDIKEIELSWCGEDDEERWIGSTGTGFEWEKALAKQVKVADDLQLTEEEIIAHCLYELTFFGFTPQEYERCVEQWMPRKEPRNQYEATLWALQQRMYKNEVKRKDRFYDESGKGLYPYNGKSQFAEPRQNRTKRKRKYRQEKREEYLEQMSARENLLQRITRNSDFERKDVAFILTMKRGHEVTFHSHVANKEERMPYLLNLITDYYRWDDIEGTDIICLLRTSSANQLSNSEKEILEHFLLKFPQMRIHQAIGTDEELAVDVALDVIIVDA